MLTAFSIGALGFGLLVDVIGRKWAFNLTCLITSMFGMLLVSSFAVFVANADRPPPSTTTRRFVASTSCLPSASEGEHASTVSSKPVLMSQQHPHRRYDRSRIPSSEPTLPCLAPVHVAADRCRGGFRHCVRDSRQVSLRRRVAGLQRGCIRRGVLLSLVEHGLEVSTSIYAQSADLCRYLVIVLGCMTLAIFFLRYFVFTFYESPKFLLSKGKEQEAIDVLHKIAKFNRAPPPVLTIEHFAEIDQAQSQSTTATPTGQLSTAQTTKKVARDVVRSLSHLKALFTNKLQAVIFVLLAIAYIVSAHQHIERYAEGCQGDYWSFNLAGSFLPIVLLRNNVSSGQGTVTDTYRQYVYIYLPGILGAVLALLSVQLPLVGRKWSLVFSAAMQG
jgi:hypothetical protein